VSDKDTIYRQDAIKYFTELWECIGTISDREEWEDVCVTTVNEMKSAQPRQKGKWLLIDAGYYDYVKCSQCGETLVWGKNFCPNCGCDMREGEEE